METKYTNLDMIEKVDEFANSLHGEKKKIHRNTFFPKMIEEFKLKIAVEVGVNQGAFSNHLLTNTSLEKLYCIDTWQNNYGDVEGDDGDSRFAEAKTTLSSYLGDRAEMIRNTSLNASKQFENESLDFCYIDGDHSLEGIYIDLLAWVPKMKIGGIIGGHDYKDGKRSGVPDFFGKSLPCKVVTAVDYYSRRYGYKRNTFRGRVTNWWFVKNKQAEDVFGDFLNS